MAGGSPAQAVREMSGKSPACAASVRMPASARTGKLPAPGEGGGGGGTGNRFVRASGNDGGSGEAAGGAKRAMLGTSHGMKGIPRRMATVVGGKWQWRCQRCHLW